MTANATVQTLDTLRTRLNRLHDRDGLSWREIASQGEFSGIPAATLHAIARQGREPKNHAHRHALGLPPVAIPVEPCPDCGRVHRQLATCAPKPRRATKRRLSFWVTDEEFSRAIAAINEYTGPRAEWLMNKIDGE